jgi:hypothetical protein
MYELAPVESLPRNAKVEIADINLIEAVTVPTNVDVGVITNPAVLVTLGPIVCVELLDIPASDTPPNVIEIDPAEYPLTVITT